MCDQRENDGGPRILDDSIRRALEDLVYLTGDSAALQALEMVEQIYVAKL